MGTLRLLRETDGASGNGNFKFLSKYFFSTLEGYGTYALAMEKLKCVWGGKIRSMMVCVRRRGGVSDEDEEDEVRGRGGGNNDDVDGDDDDDDDDDG